MPHEHEQQPELSRSRDLSSGSFKKVWLLPATVALLTLATILSSIDAAGDYAFLRQGPGLTIDEIFNVEEGVRLVQGIQGWIVGVVTIRDIFGDQDDLPPNAIIGYHNPDHPPLGRLCIGLVHSITTTILPPLEHSPDHPFVTSAARPASAIAFAVTILLVGVYASRWYGSIAGLTSALSLVLMPRLFGHAHLASLETIANMFVTATILFIADRWGSEAALRRKDAAIGGLLFGLALLSKIQAVLIPVPIAIWALWKFRTRAVIPLMIFGGVGFAVFFAGWPWLWLDPVAHLREYFARTTDRMTLYVWYCGAKFSDRSVPWHYPWVMFLLTVPAGLHALGAAGLMRQEQEEGTLWRERLLLACIATSLVLFSLPGIPVYDGVRLFLVVFPLWGIFIGRGGVLAYDWMRSQYSARRASIFFGVYLSLHAAGLLALAPCYLSYYNIVVGGPPGAERLGLETTYWGDSFTRTFLTDTVREIPENTSLEVSPQIHQFHFGELINQSPIIRKHGVHLRPFTTGPHVGPKYRLIFFRRADLPKFLREIPPNAEVLATTVRQGVTLAVCYRIDESK